MSVDAGLEDELGVGVALGVEGQGAGEPERRLTCRRRRAASCRPARRHVGHGQATRGVVVGGDEVVLGALGDRVAAVVGAGEGDGVSRAEAGLARASGTCRRRR